MPTSVVLCVASSVSSAFNVPAGFGRTDLAACLATDRFVCFVELPTPASAGRIITSGPGSQECTDFFSASASAARLYNLLEG
ncbi:hypothetical protein HBH98_149930 [Parastagonospora nodorum]|nr:hypothetical protein HBH54_013320 [Parastagonospora nodorum]KAH3967493.1 hypothetical protein HBH51_137050 [Parastagonospora nodorum]KAH3990280.1 hypothetical protein HBH52_002260 [Parastagonospora nodorum]KAH4006478.1 hypothetical protein HBI10_013240 [Parastagonospora nodorum]KAH4034656.1 hypothetical protein HBI09_101650 [Parastagonospora nodorum]